MSLGALSDRYRVEVCALEEYVDSSLGNSGLLTAKNSGKAHRLLSICNHKVGSTQCTLHAVKCDELLAFLCPAHYDLTALDLRRIECVKRLSDLVKNKVCDVHNVVDRTETDSKELLLKPLWRSRNLYSLDCSTCISRSSIHSGNLYRDSLAFTFCKSRNIRDIKLAWDIVVLEISVEVTCNTDMRSCVHTVCSKTDLYDRVCRETEIILCRSTHDCLWLEDHDSIMRLAYAELVLRADHTERLDSTDL